MQLALIIPDGVGVKNYLYTSFLGCLAEKGVRLLLIHALPNEAIIEIHQRHPTIQFESVPLPAYREALVIKYLRETARKARLMRQARKERNTTYMQHVQKPSSKWLRRLFYWITFISAALISYSQQCIILIDKLAWKLLNGPTIKIYSAYYKKHNTSKVLLLHQRAVVAAPAIKAAEKLNIPTSTIIYSWDNIPKASLPVRTHSYFVWSRHMKNELIFYYPEIKPEQVVITGTPQFEVYEQKQLIWTKEKFYDQLGLTNNTKLICYCGGDKRTSPYDQLFLRDMAQKIYQSRFKESLRIILRPTPIDNSSRYDEVVNTFSDIIIKSTPIWYHNLNGTWQQSIPLFSDAILLANLIYHCDAAYTLGSTMAFDFAMHKKPTAFINYTPKGAGNWQVKPIYRFKHFQTMPSSPPVYWIDETRDITWFIESVAKENIKYPESMEQWKRKIIAPLTESSSRRLSKVCLNKNT